MTRSLVLIGAALAAVAWLIHQPAFAHDTPHKQAVALIAITVPFLALDIILSIRKKRRARGPLAAAAGRDQGQGGGRAVVSQKAAASRAGRLPVSPAVLWTGIALGVFLAVEAVVHGVVLPLSLGVLADAALTFLLIVAAAVVLAELTRRHHRTVLRHGGRCPHAGARHARRHGGTGSAWLAAKAGPRWERPGRTGR